MNARTPGPITRREFGLLAATIAAGASIVPRAVRAARAVEATPTTEAVPRRLAGRRFIAHSRQEAVSALTTIVREYAAASIATHAVAMPFARETAPITDMEASITRASSAPIADPAGLDGEWTIIAGAAGVETFHRGIFFATDRLVWTIVASRFAERPNPSLPLDLARSVHARFEDAFPDGAPRDLDLWRLLPDETDRDLGGRYRLEASFDEEQPRW